MRMFEAPLAEFENNEWILDDFWPIQKQPREWVEGQINWARTTLKKNDAIVWYLRWIRLHLYVIILRGLEGSVPPSHSDPSSMRAELVARKQNLARLEPMMSKLAKKAGLDGIDETSFIARQFPSGWKTDLEHYMSLDIPAINDYQFGNKPPPEVRNDLIAIEKKWKEKFDGLIEMKDDDQIIMEFEDGTAWLYLPRWACDAESKAMGHCGNRGGFKSDRILSFRSRVEGPKGKTMWRPHLTFILKNNDRLGEMKGKGNDKPSPKYHKYIVALLMSDEFEVKDTDWIEQVQGFREYDHDGNRVFEIEGIEGGGYLPENNFSVEDLDAEEAKRVLRDKPQMGTLSAHYKAFGWTDELKSRVPLLLSKEQRNTPEEQDHQGHAISYEHVISYDQDKDLFKVRCGSLYKLVHNAHHHWLPKGDPHEDLSVKTVGSLLADTSGVLKQSYIQTFRRWVEYAVGLDNSDTRHREMREFFYDLPHDLKEQFYDAFEYATREGQDPTPTQRFAKNKNPDVMSPEELRSFEAATDIDEYSDSVVFDTIVPRRRTRKSIYRPLRSVLRIGVVHGWAVGTLDNAKMAFDRWLKDLGVSIEGDNAYVYVSPALVFKVIEKIAKLEYETTYDSYGWQVLEEYFLQKEQDGASAVLDNVHPEFDKQAAIEMVRSGLSSQDFSSWENWEKSGKGFDVSP